MEDIFGIKKGSIICITGSGGKTSLMYFLAKKLSKSGKVVITTTTKIYTPLKACYEELVIEKKKIKGKAKNITVIGKNHLEGKISSLSYEKINELSKIYDYVLVEGDGAKEKILKGWHQKEPCIPEFADIVIGVVNIRSLGKQINEKNIHRLDIFLDNTKEKTGNLVKRKTLEKYISSGDFFRKSKGKNYIYINGIEREKDSYEALYLGINKYNTYFGSMYDKWINKYRKIDAIVMASGYSKRFNGDKLLEKVEGKSILEYLLEKLRKLPFEKIYVVGRDSNIEALSKKYGYNYIENFRAHLGQSESIKAGLEYSKNEGVMFFPGDQLFIKKESILRLMLEFEKINEITIPIIGGKPSSPVIFPMKYKKELLKLQGDTGGREIIKSVKTVKKVRFLDSKEFMDIDTKDDLKKAEDIMKDYKM